MVTNTFAPHVGGVARSVTAFTEEYRRRGHRVVVVAPEFPGTPDDEEDVIRIKAFQNFNGSDFSVVLKPPLHVARAVDAFRPDIIHSHHPFLLGSTALRLARSRRIALVFTHHTLYERYTHYVPGDSTALKRFIVRLSTNYANLCARVFAPSHSTARTLRERQVEAPMSVVPTGVRLADFTGGHGGGMRAALGIPDDAVVVGYLGRLAEEKNLRFLGEAMARFLVQTPAAYAIIVGEGPLREAMQLIFSAAGVADRVRFTGALQSMLLASAYKAMDVFTFASTSETQGLVLAEAMAAGTPVVALDAPGAREIIQDRVNGRLLADADTEAFCAGIASVTSLPGPMRRQLAANAHQTAAQLSLERCADRALTAYESMVANPAREMRAEADEAWYRTVRMLSAEWELLSAAMGAASSALQRSVEISK
jgi:1,2-diacylglycerol 3-alpha-glucosyltransferase